MQNKNLYEDLSAPTLATASIFSLPSVAAAEGRHIAAVDRRESMDSVATEGTDKSS
jgi:hypothetical protein